jgi:ribosome recycling factor
MSDWRGKMEKTVRHLAEQLQGIRPGTLSVGFVETFRVTSHGRSFPIARLAAIASQGERILITPFDKADVPGIVKALVDARLNAYAANPATVCVSVPPPSAEQRAEMARHVKALGEEAKIAVRGVRQEARKRIAARGRGSERAVQEATDAAVAEIDRLVKAKTEAVTRG